MAAVVPVLSIAGAVIGGVASYSQAKAQNAATRASMQSSRESAAVQQKQLLEQTSAERRKRIVESQQTTGRLRAAAAEAGGLSGSFLALTQQNAFDTQLNDQNLLTSYANNSERIRTGLNADLASLSSRQQNLLLSTFMGTAQGTSAGLGLGQGYQSIRDYANTSERTGQSGHAGPFR